MNTFWNNSKYYPLRAEVRSLSRKLTRAYQREAKRLVHSPETLAETEASHSALRSLTQTRATIDQVLRAEHIVPERIIGLLTTERQRVQKLVAAENLDSYFRAGELSVLTMNLLFLSEGRINERFQATAKPEKPVDIPVSRLTITSDLIYQMYQNLFPAEKMLVASGQRTGSGVKIGAVFEVTGKYNSGHVLADPSRLARALISMDITDTHFALWLHSHPGAGKQWTRPSSIDINQHADWLRDYSRHLVSAIMVEDRWIRFWGTALENNQIDIEITGPGITREEEHESIYRLEQ